MATEDGDGPIRDVYGRRAKPLTPRGVGDPQTQAAERAIRAAAAEQTLRFERDVRTGAIPTDPGQGSVLMRELRGVVVGVQQEAIEALRETRAAIGGLKQGIRRQMAEATVALDQSLQDGPVPAQTGSPHRAAQARAARQAAQASGGDPVHGEQDTDTKAAKPQPDPIAAHRAKVDAAIRRGGTPENPLKDAAIRARVETADTITNRVGEFLQHRAQEIQAKPFGAGKGLGQDAKGVWRYDHGSKAGGYRKGARASEEDVARFARASRTSGVMQRYGASIADATSFREGIGNALPGGMVRAAGVAGAAYAVGNNVLDFAENERQQNDAFRAIQGGEGVSGQMGAYDDRLEMRRFQMGHRLRRGFAGGMSSEQASQLFMGASQLGLQGDQRDQALDLGTANFRKYAMDVSDSLRLITAATENGQEGLTGIAEALEQVTDAAVKGGVSAKVARDNFVAAYERTAPTFAGQGTAAALAAGVSSATAGLGQGFQGVDFGAALNDPMQLRRVATEQGRSLSSVVMDTQGAQGAAGVLDSQRAIRDRAIMAQINPEGRQRLAEATALAQSEGRALTQEELEDLASQSGIDPVRMQMLLAMNGVQGVTLRNAVSTAMASVTGTADPGADVRKQAADQANYAIDPSTLEDRYLTDAAGAMTVRESQARKKVEEKIGGSGRGIDFDWNFDNKEGPANKARRAYMDSLNKTGKGSPLIEKMLKEGADQKFVVKASDGKGGKGTYNRVVNAEEAIKHFGDQLRRGDVKIAGTDQTLADTYGFDVDESVDVTSDDKVGKGNKAGRSERNWLKEEGKDKKGGGGEVLITPAPALERLLRFSGSGDVRVNNPLAPPEAHVPNSALPTGTRGP